MNTVSLEDSKDIVVYHGNCIDGFSAAWCFHHWEKHCKAKGVHTYYKGVYGQAPTFDCTGKIVYLVDFSYKKEVVKELCKTAARVILIDHHITAIEDLAPLSDPTSDEYTENFSTFTDINRSGAMLAWNYLFNFSLSYDEMEKSRTQNIYLTPPALLGYVQDRDLWRFQLSHSREIAAGMFSYPYSFEQWDDLMLNSSALVSLQASGMAIMRKQEKDIAELLDVCMSYEEIGDYLVPCVNMPYTLASEAGNILAKNWNEGKLFAATYYLTDKHKVYSLRSTEDGLDVQEIAKKYGGGGHKHAAGFRIARQEGE